MLTLWRKTTEPFKPHGLHRFPSTLLHMQDQNEYCNSFNVPQRTKAGLHPPLTSGEPIVLHPLFGNAG
eukprot:3539033-Amphidinium_carterae.1